MKKSAILGLLLCFCSFLVQAEVWTVQTVPNTKLQDAGSYISNPDGLVDAQSQSDINNILAQVERDNTAEIFVVVLKSTGDVPFKQFATELFNEWNIGKKSKDNGLLILMVEDQHHVTFETGYGMEGVLPDAICMRIIQNDILPFMREGKYGEGLLSGVKGVVKVLSDPNAAKEIQVDMQVEKAAEQAALKSKLFNILLIYLILSIVVLILSARSASKKMLPTDKQDPYSTYKNLSTSKAGYGMLTALFPLTMILFYLWYRRKLHLYRRVPRLCPVCGKHLSLMTEQQEDVYLSTGQQAEETVGSIDYDAWVCMDCGHRLFLPYAKTFTNYKTCPGCGYKTFAQTSDRITLIPTPLSCGEGMKIYSCANCHHELRKRYTIPMIVVVPVRGGGSGGGGGFGGGGSFGGGSSGGGGASGGW
ncbi:MAG: TPM domain-containing protein [Bacteroidales bacterium]|nr:TPM domain-containing protein [Bacteroidales bacterium]